MNGHLISEELKEYLDELVPPRPAEMQEMEAYAAEHSFPIIGPAAGYACYQIARMIGAQNVFELGSGYGYSSAWFAKAVRENGGGVVHHAVWDKDLSERARGHLTRLGYGDLVEYSVGEAVEALKKADGPFDLIFVDIEKDAYPESLSIVEAKLRSGGVMIVDNVLWSGRIFDQDDGSKSTMGIRELTRRVTSSPDWAATIVPIRDGLLVAYKG